MAEHHLTAIDDTNFEREVLGSPTPFLLELTARWCGPCRALAPTLEKLAASKEGFLRVGALDIEDSPRVAQRLGVRAVPTVVAFVAGAERARHTGVTSLEKLLALTE